MAADTQGAVLRTSIPIRYSPDGRSWGEGIVLSISGVTLTVQTTVIPEVRARLYFALGLGVDSTFHGEGRVTTLPDPEPGAEAIAGFGLRFDGTPNEMAATVAKLTRDYPGPVAIDADLRLRWPVAAEAAPLAKPDDDEALAVWADGRALHTTPIDDAPAARAGNVNEPLSSYVALLRYLRTELDTLGDTPVALTYRGRPLAPGTGLPARVLSAGLAGLEHVSPLDGSTATPPATSGASTDGTWSLDLEDFDAPTGPIEAAPAAETEDAPTEAEVLWDHPILELMAAQMRVMDALALADWRYERLTSELKEALDRDRTLLDGINLRIATSAEDAGIDEVVTTAIAEANDAIDTLVTRAAWHSTSIESADASASFYETFQIEKERLARQAVIAARSAAREAEDNAARKVEEKAPRKSEPARKEREEPRKAEPKKKPKTDEPRPPRASAESSESGAKQPAWKIAVLVLICIVAIARIVDVFRGGDKQRKLEPPRRESVDTGRIRSDLSAAVNALPVTDVRLESKGVAIVVDPGWLTRSAPDRHGDVERAAVALISHGFWKIRFITPDGKERAAWNQGSIQGEGFTSTPRPSQEDGAR